MRVQSLSCFTFIAGDRWVREVDEWLPWSRKHSKKWHNLSVSKRKLWSSRHSRLEKEGLCYSGQKPGTQLQLWMGIAYILHSFFVVWQMELSNFVCRATWLAGFISVHAVHILRMCRMISVTIVIILVIILYYTRKAASANVCEHEVATNQI